MYFKKTSFLVAGLQKSGFASAKFLLDNNAKVYIYDRRKSDLVVENVQKLISLGAIVIEDYLTDLICDVLVISPGVPIDSDICKFYKANGKRIIGEMELAYLQINTPIIAVTGTNGKTTTCNMIHKCLENANISSVLAGNVGVPLVGEIEKVNKSELCVLEVSSYQLETTYLFCPHISVVLNITPDHLDRHYTMENYALVKSKIVIPLKESEFSVLNFDDELVRDFSSVTNSKVIYFSKKEKVSGAYLDGENVCFNGEELFKVNELSLKESHNIENALATVCVLKCLKVENSVIKNTLCEFNGVKHRFEKVKTVNGVTFINDSKSTNEASAIKAVENLNNKTVLIIGGADKGLNYSELMRSIKNSRQIKNTVITGECSAKMLSFAIDVGVDNVSVVKGFENAVKTAYKLATSGEDVLLSPATSSFDEFKNFEERGEKFVEIVNLLGT